MLANPELARCAGGETHAARPALPVLLPFTATSRCCGFHLAREEGWSGLLSLSLKAKLESFPL